jgi:hypothetical protein
MKVSTIFQRLKAKANKKGKVKRVLSEEDVVGIVYP